MKSPLLAKLLVLTAALAITLTPGCRRKTQTPITPIPARTGEASGIKNPTPGLPRDGAGGTDRGGKLGDGAGARGSELGGPGAAGTDVGGANGVKPGDNLALEGGPLDRSKYNENRTQFANDTVFFDFDSSVVKTSEKTKVGTVAHYLKSNPTAAVEVEGHCDERGTEEYNRSLGERRALAVREELALKGVDPKRIYTISYGEDRPAVNGHDDAAWSKNRRGEFILLTPR